MTRRPARRNASKREDRLKNFGDLINADHVISHSAESMGLTGERNALVVLDVATEYKDCFPLMSKDAVDAHGAMLEFIGEDLPKVESAHRHGQRAHQGHPHVGYPT